ncbi:hypothetical protein Patl1_10850 [Pistacia atlantica]|uniref:Uncharacterized protein n=1 Tax=Pistacia atlantica TaxID=434234 RepID=A0ACC1A9B3_9ROSI|nr:hypothetical protein Patl1_10850 [Pistacia atlantica]
MASARNTRMNNGGVFYSSPRFSSGRLIPKRGQVKLGIVLGLAHSFASIFSLNNRCKSARFSQ